MISTSVTEGATDLAEFWVRWPDECCIAVTRKGRGVPCDKTAVAVLDCNDSRFPVCKRHAKGKGVVPLKMLIEELIGVSSPR